MVLAIACTAALGLAQSGDNVLIVIADDLGVDQVPAYGEGTAPPRTPTIDGLAARGVLFRNAWAYPTCSPARACLSTGRYGFRTGIGSPVRAALELEETTVPEALDAAASGYRHAWIGKWHLGGGPSRPNDSGWSHFAGLRGGGVSDYFNWTRTVNGQSSTSTTYATTQIADDAIAWIGAQSGAWVCVLAFNAPHTPFHAPPPNLHTQVLTGTPNTNPVPHYKASIEALDTELGRVLTSLGSAVNRTHVIFIGDNGTPRQVTEAPFIRNHAKGTPYEGGVRVPLIAAGPTTRSPGRQVDSVVSIVDLFATVGDLTGTDLRSSFVAFDSVSFAPYLEDPTAGPLRESIYSESFDNGNDPLTDGFACARSVDYKLIRRYAANGTATEEFYHLPSDPFEQTDLIPLGLNAPQQFARDALAATIDSVRDTSPRFEAYGTESCVGSNGIPRIRGTGSPRIGGTYQIELDSGVASGPVTLTAGSSSASFGALDLPFDMTRIGGGTGCFLYASLDLTVTMTSTAAGRASVAIPLPNEPLLLGAAIHHTWLCIDSAAPGNRLGVVSTAGVRAIPGR